MRHVRARIISLCRKAFAAMHAQATWRAWRRNKAVSLYVKQAFSALRSSLDAWLRCKQTAALHRSPHLCLCGARLAATAALALFSL